MLAYDFRTAPFYPVLNLATKTTVWRKDCGDDGLQDANQLGPTFTKSLEIGVYVQALFNEALEELLAPDLAAVSRIYQFNAGRSRAGEKK